MKKIFFVLIGAWMVASCLPESEYSSTDPVYADFEYSGITYDETFGTDSVYFESNLGYGFGWDYLAFRHKVDTLVAGNWTFEGGTLLSYLKSDIFDPTDSLSMAQGDSLAWVEGAYRANVQSVTPYINTYAVYYGNPDVAMMPEHDVEFMAREYGTCQMGVCYVSNTRYVAYKVAQTFQDGDRLTLTAKGYYKGAKTSEVSFTLADFSAQKDSIVSAWTPFDLSGLGNVEYVDFEVLSTKEDVPAYFCMDNISASVTISY